MFLLVGAAGALVGALGLSALTVLLYWLFEPEAFRDGQFVVLFIFTIPFGALLGVITGLVVRQVRLGNTWRAGWLATASGTSVLAFATLIVWGSADSRGDDTGEFLSTLLSLWIAPSWFAAAGLTIWGTLLLAARR